MERYEFFSEFSKLGAQKVWNAVDSYWQTPTTALRDIGDPAKDLRVTSSLSRFWANGGDDDECDIDQDSGVYPSALTDNRLANKTAFTVEQLVQKIEGLPDQKFQEQATVIDTYKKEVKNFLAFDQTVPPSSKLKPWHGPLPPKRISPSLTLADCPVLTDLRHKKKGHRRLRDLGGALCRSWGRNGEFQILNRDPRFPGRVSDAVQRKGVVTDNGPLLGSNDTSPTTQAQGFISYQSRLWGGLCPVEAG